MSITAVERMWRGAAIGLLSHPHSLDDMGAVGAADLEGAIAARER
jgi:hypothetical protein